MKNKLSKALALMGLAAGSLNASAQTEYLVTVDPATGVYQKVKNLPGVGWIWTTPDYTTFDETNHRYIFKGSADQVNWQLFSVDALTGNIVSSPSFPQLSDLSDNVIELQFDNSANILYGLHWDNSEATEYLVTIDPVTGVFTKVKDIPGVHWVMMGSTTYDSDNHRYVFKGSADQASWHLFTIDAVTGNTVSSPTYPAASGTSSGTVHRLQYDHAMQKYFGLTWNNDENQEFLVEVDPVTGFYTQVGAVQGLSSLSKASYDEAHHRFMVVGPDFGGIWHLYSIDVNTAAVVSSPTFPELSSPTKNVIEFQYDNASEILYALHWDPTQVDSIETTGISNMQPGNRLFDVYPNPFADQVKIALPGTFREVSTELTNALGQVVRQQTDHNTSTLTLHRNGLASGVYFIMVTGDRQNMGTQKVVIK